MTRTARTRDDRGFALLIVLWTMGLLALLVTVLTASARVQTHLAGGVRGDAMAEAAADGGVHQAIFQLHAGRWAADRAPRRVRIGASAVEIVIEDEGGRINPNFSPPPLLAALLDLAGVDPAGSTILARRIFDWRTASVTSIDGGPKLDQYRRAGLPYGPANRPFASVDEIGLVPGMTPDLLERLRPYLSVYQYGDPSAAAGPETGRSAMRDAEVIAHASVMAGFNSPYKVLRITASASAPGGVRFVRTALVRLPARAGSGPAAPRILTWDRVDGGQPAR